MGQGGLPADGLGDHGRDQGRVGAQLVVLGRELVQGHDAAGDGVPGGVVAADDQQEDIPAIGVAVHVPGRRVVHQHGDQVGRGLGVDLLVPELLEGAEALAHGLELVLPALHGAVARRVGDDVRPVGQLAAVLEGEVEQGRQGHGGQFLRHQVDPVELLADGQGVEDQAGPLADDGRHALKVGRRHGGADGLALRAVLRLVHGDEAGAAAGPRPGQLAQHLLLFGQGHQVRQGDALGRGEDVVVGVHRHDVLPPGHGPVGPEVALGGEVDGVLAPQAGEDGQDGVLLEPVGATRVQELEGGFVGLADGLVGIDPDGDVHGALPFLPFSLAGPRTSAACRSETLPPARGHVNAC